MTRPLRSLGIFLCVLVGLLVTYFVLFPLYFKIKEPFFAMPIAFGKEPRSIADLPVRNDAYGDGHFGAERKNARRHKGLDLAAKLKSPVYASKSGWAKVYVYPDGYGNLVVINHPWGWQTRYGHLDKVNIRKFQWVSRGDTIGTVGKTGNANSRGIVPHLHFEIRHKGEALDPAGYLVQKS